MLGIVRVKGENAQLNDLSKIVYPLYPLRLLTKILASYKRYTEHRVQRVQERIRFDNAFPKGG